MSVCLSNAWIVTKRKKVESRFLRPALSPRFNSAIMLILCHNVFTESHVYSKIPIGLCHWDWSQSPCPFHTRTGGHGNSYGNPILTAALLPFPSYHRAVQLLINVYCILIQVEVHVTYLPVARVGVWISWVSTATTTTCTHANKISD